MEKNTKYLIQNKVLKFTSDVVFKNIMKNKNNKEFLARVISIFTNMDEKYVLDNIVLKDTDTLENSAKEHYNTGDLLVDIEDNRINIEMSINNKELNKRKNEITSYKYASNRFKSGSNYKRGYKFIQIIIENYKVFNNDLIVNEVQLVETSSGNYEVETDEFKKYHICLSNIPKEWYTKDEEKLTTKEKMLLFFTTDDAGKLKKITKGDEVMEKTFKSLESISEDSDIISEYERKQIFDHCYNEALDEREQAGIQKGIEKGKIEIIKNMLNKKMDINFISEITDLPVNELTKLC